MKRSGDQWLCAECGHNLEVDQTFAMEMALSHMGDEGSCSAKNMTFAQTALYIRTLGLRWMDDQRRIHRLERDLRMLTDLPLPERTVWNDARLRDAEQQKAPARERAGAFAD